MLRLAAGLRRSAGLVAVVLLAVFGAGCGGFPHKPLPIPSTPIADPAVVATDLTNGRVVGRTAGTLWVGDDGSASYRIPLWVPPGRASIEPALALSYNSNGGTSLLGVGWSLDGLSEIRRCRRTLAKDGEAREIRFVDGNDGDRYCLDGQRLIAVGGVTGSASPYGATGTEYRTERDMHAKVVSNATDAAGPTSFTVFLKDGRILTYGGVGAVLGGLRLDVQSAANGAFTYHHQQNVRYAWALSRIEDRAGNYARIAYHASSSDYGYDLRPDTIWYTGFSPAYGQSASLLPPRRAIRFIYGARPDTQEAFVGGLRLLRTDRLTSIEAVYDTGAAVATNIRSYRFTYAAAKVSGRSLLRTVKECDGGGACKRPTTFEWTSADTTFTDSTTTDVMPTVPATNTTTQLWATGAQTADVDLDGRDEYLTTTPVTVGCTNLPQTPQTGLFHGPLGSLESGQPSPPNRFADLNGDGKADVIALVRQHCLPPNQSWPPGWAKVIVYLSGPNGYYEMPDTASWSHDANTPYALDLNGDGTPELLHAPGPTANGGSNWEYRLNTGGTLGPWIATPLSVFWPSSYNPPDPYTGIALDAFGSGKLGLLSNGNLLTLGPTGLTARYLQLPEKGYCDPIFADVNGDGLADWVARKSGTRDIGISINTGHGFLAPVDWTLPTQYETAYGEPSYPLFCDARLNTGVRIIDYDMDGRQDLLLMAGIKTGPGPQVSGSSAGNPTDETRAPRQLVVLRSTGHGFMPKQLTIRAGDPSSWSSSYIKNVGPLWAYSLTLDVNADGLTDLTQYVDSVRHVYTRNGDAGDVLAKVTDGLGVWDSLTYVAIGRPGFTYAADSACGYPQKCIRHGLWVVATRTSDNGSAPPRRWTFSYTGARVDLGLGEWLGFADRQSYDWLSLTRTETTSDVTTRIGGLYPYAFLPKRTVTRTATQLDRAKATFVEHQALFTYDTIGSPTSPPFFVYPKKIEHTVRESTLSTSPVLVQMSTATQTQDAFGNVTSATDQYQPVSNGQAVGIPTTTESTIQYDNFEASWLVGLARSSSVKSKTPNGLAVTRVVEMDYDGVTGYPWKVRVEPGSQGTPETSSSGFFTEQTIHRTDEGLISAVVHEGSGQTRTDSVAYDSVEHAFPVAMRNAVGQWAHVRVQPLLGVATSATDPNGVTVRRTVDGFGRLKSIDRPGAADAALTYDLDSLGRARIRLTVGGAGSSDHVYDGLGRLAYRMWDGFDGTRALSELRYDSLGRVSGVSLPRWQGTPYRYVVFEYDNLNRPTRITYPDFGFRRFAYSGTRRDQWDQENYHSWTISDELDRVVKLVRADTGSHTVTTAYAYGPFGVLRQVTDPAGTAATMEYDRLGRRERVVDPNAGTVRVRYNAFGELKWLETARHDTITYARDSLGRITSMSSPDGLTTLQWDSASHGIGLLAATSSPDGVLLSYHYDSLSRVDAETVSVGTRTVALNWRYDQFGRPDQIQYPSSPGRPRFVATLAFTASGYLESIGDTAGTAHWTVTSRDAMSQERREEFGSGLATVRGYDDMGRLDSIATGTTAAPTSIQDLRYEYDPRGNLYRRYDGGWIEQFLYDPLGRLSEWGMEQTGTAKTADVHYGYNDIGAMKWRTIPTGVRSSDTLFYTYGAGGAGPAAAIRTVHGADTVQYGYDAAGDRHSGRGLTIDYTTFHLPRQIHYGSHETKFAYDAGGRRVLKWDDVGDSTWTIEDLYEARVNPYGTTHVFTLPGSNRNVAQVLWAAASQGGDRVIYLHDDQLGSIDSFTDQSGAVIDRMKFDPFGRRQDPNNRGFAPAFIVPSPVRLGFAGQEHDTELGLVNMRGRLYDSELGQFVAADPATIGSSGWGMSRYSYARNNPLTLTDPSGYEEVGRSWSQSDFEPMTITGKSAQSVVFDEPMVIVGSAGPQRNVAFDPVTIIGNPEASGGGGSWSAHGGGSEHQPTGSGSQVADDRGTRTVPSQQQLQQGYEANKGNASPSQQPLQLKVFPEGPAVVPTIPFNVPVHPLEQQARDKYEQRYRDDMLHGREPTRVEPRTGTWDEAFGLGFDWLFQTGPETAVFPDGSPQVQDLKDAPGIQKAREYFYTKNAAHIRKGEALEPVTNYGAGFGLSGLVAAGSDPTEQFVGNYTVDIYPVSNSEIRIYVRNTTSRESAFYHAPVDNPSRSSAKWGGNMMQIYTWSEAIPPRPF